MEQDKGNDDWNSLLYVFKQPVEAYSVCELLDDDGFIKLSMRGVLNGLEGQRSEELMQDVVNFDTELLVRGRPSRICNMQQGTCVEYLEDIREQLPDQKRVSKKPADLKLDKKHRSSTISSTNKAGEPKNSIRRISKHNSKTLVMKDDHDKEASTTERQLAESPPTGSKKKELKAERRQTFTGKITTTQLTPAKTPSELKKDQKQRSTAELRDRRISRVEGNDIESVNATPLDFVYDGDKNKRALSPQARQSKVELRVPMGGPRGIDEKLVGSSKKKEHSVEDENENDFSETVQSHLFDDNGDGDDNPKSGRVQDDTQMALIYGMGDQKDKTDPFAPQANLIRMKLKENFQMKLQEKMKEGLLSKMNAIDEEPEALSEGAKSGVHSFRSGDYKPIKLVTQIADVDRLITMEKVYLVKEKKKNKTNKAMFHFMNQKCSSEQKPDMVKEENEDKDQSPEEKMEDTIFKNNDDTLIEMIINESSQQYNEEETIYQCQHRKHFMNMKQSKQQQCNDIKFNNFYIMSTAQTFVSSDSQVSALSKLAKSKTQRHEIRNNEAYIFLQKMNISNQSVLKFEDLIADTVLQQQDAKDSLPEEENVVQKSLDILDSNFGRQNLQMRLINKDEYLNYQYLLIYSMSILKKTDLFIKFRKKYIYYQVFNQPKGIPAYYFCRIKHKKFDQFTWYQNKTMNEIKPPMKPRISNYNAGPDNFQYIFSFNNVLNQTVRELVYVDNGIMSQIRKLIYQNRYCLVRHLLHQPFQEEKSFIIPKFLELSYRAYQKDDAYRYNLKYEQMLKHKYDDSSESESDFDEETSNQVLSNFYSKATEGIRFDSGSINILDNVKGMGTTKKPDQKEQKKELKAEKKSKILDAIKKIDNEKGKLHDTIKIDEEILMVNYESIKLGQDTESEDEQNFHQQEIQFRPIQYKFEIYQNEGLLDKTQSYDGDSSVQENTFQLCMVFGYGQYLIHEGMYDLFLNELKSESVKVLTDKEQKRKRKEEKQKAKKAKMLEMEASKQGISVGLYFLGQIQGRKKYRMAWRTKNGVKIATPEQLNPTQKSVTFLNFESQDVQIADYCQLKSLSLKSKNVDGFKTTKVEQLTGISASPMQAHSHGHTHGGHVQTPDFTFRSLLSRTMTARGKTNEDDKDKPEEKKAEDSHEEQKVEDKHEHKCSITQSLKKYLKREDGLDVVDEIKNDDEKIGIEEETSFVTNNAALKRKSFMQSNFTNKLGIKESQKPNLDKAFDGQKDVFSSMANLKKHSNTLRKTSTRFKIGNKFLMNMLAIKDVGGETNVKEQLDQKISLVQEQKRIQEEMIYEVTSDGEIDKRPVHLRQLCHFKQFIQRIDKDIENKLEKVEFVVHEVSSELEADNEVADVMKETLLRIRQEKEEKQLQLTQQELENKRKRKSTFSPINDGIMLHKSIELQSEFLHFEEYEQIIHYDSDHSSANSWSQNDLESENSEKYQRQIDPEESPEDKLDIYKIKYDTDDSGNWSEEHIESAPDCEVGDGDFDQRNVQRYNSMQVNQDQLEGSKKVKRLRTTMIDTIDLLKPTSQLTAVPPSIMPYAHALAPSLTMQKLVSVTTPVDLDIDIFQDNRHKLDPVEEAKDQQAKNLQRLERNLKKKAFKEVLGARKMDFFIDDEKLLFMEKEKLKKSLQDLNIMTKLTKVQQLSESKLKQIGKKIMQSKKNLNVVKLFNEEKDIVASRVTRKAGQLSEYEQMKLIKSIENDQDQVIKDFVLFNVQMINQPLNLPNIAEYTLLELSAHYGRASIVDVLLKSGADPNRLPTNPNGDTPLHIAIKQKYKKIIDLLISANADEDVLNNDFLTPWQTGLNKEEQEEARHQNKLDKILNIKMK